LSVTSGWVALQANERESMVPEGASCETKLATGPGTPYFRRFVAGISTGAETIDFDKNPATRAEALESMLSQSRARDT
jgi:hypothetical protein